MNKGIPQPKIDKVADSICANETIEAFDVIMRAKILLTHQFGLLAICRDKKKILIQTTKYLLQACVAFGVRPSELLDELGEGRA